MNKEQIMQGYMAQSAMPPNSLDGLFKPLGEHVRKDIELITAFLKVAPTNKQVTEAFNRLMAELHVVTESSVSDREMVEAFSHDLTSIDAVLKEANLKDGSTAQNVAKLVRHNQKVNRLLAELVNVSNKHS